jgi:hypothetical protein
MERELSFKLTRRNLCAGAAAGAAAGSLAYSGIASAQQSSTPRVKGRAVWLDMDQEELDASYDNDAYVTNHAASLSYEASSSSWSMKSSMPHMITMPM